MQGLLKICHQRLLKEGALLTRVKLIKHSFSILSLFCYRLAIYFSNFSGDKLLRKLLCCVGGKVKTVTRPPFLPKQLTFRVSVLPLTNYQSISYLQKSLWSINQSWSFQIRGFDWKYCHRLFNMTECSRVGSYNAKLTTASLFVYAGTVTHKFT